SAPPRHLHRADLHRLVVLDYEGESALRSALDHRIRHHDAALTDGHQQAGVDELARPEPQIGVGESRLELDGAAGYVDLVVNHGELAFAQDVRVVLADRDHREV